jgi:hypothetical protein
MSKIFDSVRKKGQELTEMVLDSDISKNVDVRGKIETVKEKTQDTYQKTREILGTGKEHTYKGVAKLEEQFENDHGVGGEVNSIVKKARLLLRGIKFASKPLVGNHPEKIAQKAKEYYNLIDAYNKGFITTFTTEGEYDETKFNHFLLNKVALSEVYGKKAIDTIVESVKSSATGIHKDYREFIPTQEELKTKYAGIGQTLEVVLLKPDLEKCLGFHDSVYEALPKSKITPEIMKDIKDNAITNKNDLLKLYIPKSDEGVNIEKANLVLNYLNN